MIYIDPMVKSFPEAWGYYLYGPWNIRSFAPAGNGAYFRAEHKVHFLVRISSTRSATHMKRP